MLPDPCASPARYPAQPQDRPIPCCCAAWCATISSVSTSTLYFSSAHSCMAPAAAIIPCAINKKHLQQVSHTAPVTLVSHHLTRLTHKFTAADTCAICASHRGHADAHAASKHTAGQHSSWLDSATIQSHTSSEPCVLVYASVMASVVAPETAVAVGRWRALCTSAL